MMTLAWIGWPEMVVVGVVAVLIFGRRLPEVGRSLGKGLLEFKKGLRGVRDEVKEDVKEAAREAEQAAADVHAAASDGDEHKG